MSGFWSFRRVVTSSVLVAAVAGAGALFAADAPSTAPAVEYRDAPVVTGSVATINGNKEINAKFFYDTLMEIDGVRVFEKVRDLALVQTDCETNAIPVGGPGENDAQKKDFQTRFMDEFNRAFDSLKISGLPADTKLDDAKKLEIVNQVLSKQGINPVEFKMTLETHTGLRVLSKGKVDVSDDEIKKQYNAEYGPVVHVRVFPVGDDVKQQADIRKAIEAEKLSPDKVADKAADDLKINKPGSGAIPMSLKDEDKSSLVQVSLATKVGELSAATDLPSQNGQPAQKGMIYVESIDADKRAATILTPALHDELRQKIFDAKQEAWMNNHLAMLRANASIKINDPTLFDMYKNIADQINNAAKTAATQPGGAPPATNAGAAGAGSTGGAGAPAGPEPTLPKLPTEAPKANK